MQLSVVIVNYNVKYFLEQCLHSVYKAIKGIDAEVFVVDNNSIDGSCSMVKEKFPWVNLICNNKNTGFSYANNQAIRISKGKYVLLLNPDTVVQEDTFSKCIAFMENNPQAGAIGVKMIDGKGNFLPESKRALPTPEVAFYKIFGLARLFPQNRRFGQYHLSYLDKDKTNEADILCGAFMFMRKEALDKSGLLDDSFFMYGEDIDLSYRIIKAGYKNYYFADTTIIHYKGESTKKGSLNYVLVFYQAMIIFAKKHFSNRRFKMFNLLIHLAIYFRALLSIVKRVAKALYLPLIDAVSIYAGYLFVIRPFSESMKYEQGGHYPFLYIGLIVPLYILIWLISMILAGTYDKPIKITNIFKGIGIGTLIILAIYGLLPLDYRFSRLMIILGAVWSLGTISFIRTILHLTGFKDFRLYNTNKKKIIIVGKYEEYLRVRQLLLQTSLIHDITGFIDETNNESPDYLGNSSQLKDIIYIYKADEIIFCAKNLSSQDIINYMLNFSASGVEFKIAPPESLSIIGSNSINTAGDLYLININAVNRPENLRSKRLFDFSISLCLLLTYIFIFPFVKNKIKGLYNILLVLAGSRTWIGYTSDETQNRFSLPKLKKGILSPVDGLLKKDLSSETIEKINFLYAKDCKVINDFNILWHGLANIGR